MPGHRVSLGACILAIAACGTEEGSPRTASVSGGGAGSGGAAGSGSASAGSGGAAACAAGEQRCSGATPQACDAAGQWQSSPDCPFVCLAGACSGVCKAGEQQCNGDVVQGCDASGQWKDGETCSDGCALGVCQSPTCKSGDVRCHGNQAQQCEPGPPATWVTKSTCNPASNQACFAPTGTCVGLQPLPVPTTVGTCHVYAQFAAGASAFLGGYDIDSYGDLLYTTRAGSFLDVYQVTLQDSDGDGKLEPDQHPDNQLHPGPMEQRTLTLVKTYSKAADGVPLGTTSMQELYAKADRVYILGSTWQNPGSISEWVFATKTSQVVVGASPDTQDGGVPGGVKPSYLGFGDADATWYGAENAFTFPASPRILSWHAPTGAWVMELATTMLGGLEVVVAPKTGQQYVYATTRPGVAYLDQYRRDPNGWLHANRFKFADASAEGGLGFGALDHFWLTRGTWILEVGGGDCTQYLK